MVIIKLIGKEIKFKPVNGFSDKELSLMVARELVKRLKKRIEEQDSKWKPLNKEYLEYKKRHGLDLRKWVATGELESSITVKHSHGSYYVTFLRKKNKEGRFFETIARANEYGTSRIPPRPLFRPVLEAFRKEMLESDILV